MANRKPQPLESVQWLPRAEIMPNDYNPNKMPPNEFELLKISILEDGWTQPIVLFEDEQGRRYIVDGEHRWQVSEHPAIAELTGGLVPVVFIRGNLSHRMMSTIRHNRARGEHSVLSMAEIVKNLIEAGHDKEQIMFLLQMEDEEVERLAERAGVPSVVAREHQAFNSGWVPGKE